MLLLKKYWKAILIIVVLLFIAVYCCINARNWEPNTVSMISGLWSAVATFMVGVIAYWQTKKYKEQADRIEDRMNAPEFYLPSFLGEYEHGIKTGGNNITVCGESDRGLQGKRTFKFMSYDKPIIQLKPIEVRIDEEVEQITIKPESGIDINYPHDAFFIGLCDFKNRANGLHEIEITMAFQNIYGAQYQKKYYGIIFVKDDWIRYSAKEKLSKAERMHENG